MRMQVHHCRQIQPSTIGTHISDITGPDLVGSTRIEAAIKNIVGDVQAMMAVGCGNEVALPFFGQCQSTHQPSNPIVPHTQPLCPQLSANATTTIDYAAFLKKHSTLLHAQHTSGKALLRSRGKRAASQEYLEILKGLTSHEFICKIDQEKPLLSNKNPLIY